MKRISILLFTVLSFSVFAQDTAKVMFYNVLNFSGNNPQRKDTLKKIVQYYKPDIFMITEIKDLLGSNYILNGSLNVNGINYYAAANFIDGPDSDNMLYYNSNKFGLVSQNNIPTDLRDINEYVLYYKSPNLANEDTIYLYCYVAHLKASQGYENERNLEAQAFIDYVNQKSNLKNVIFTGDLNLYGASEPAFSTLTNGGNIKLYDPANRVGEWHNNPSFSDVLTQSTRDSDIGDGGSIGGMDDRFDFILVSEDINTTGYNGVKYVSNSYHPIGQDGLRYDQSVISPANQDVPQDIATALYYMSDHLPVKMEVVLDNNLVTNTQFYPQPRRETNIYYNADAVKLKNTDNIRTVEVYNLLGVKLKSFNGNSTEVTIDKNTFAEGIYFVKITTENHQVETLKIKL
ncbi:MAG: T9SS C-terminal target domain-containing protein [Bacteroidetes bacterium]|nr:MAG: T9SS C-terminal target domain-containing protein [Bacteroidota bacterium]